MNHQSLCLPTAGKSAHIILDQVICIDYLENNW